MRDRILTAEAEECRLLATELAGKSEAPFLLHLASAFDDLHVGKVNLTQGGFHESDVRVRRSGEHPTIQRAASDC
jgi:hypothetical protein